jgi:hypothetical protein
MPLVTETLIDAWASCANGKCAGHKQERVQAIETETQFSYIDLGGDLPGIERSTTVLRFNDLADAQCPHCGEPRFVTDQVRPIYQNISGQPQDYLLHQHDANEKVRDLELANAKAMAQMAQMQATMERQNVMIERLLAREETEVPAKPKGRPVKGEPQA